MVLIKWIYRRVLALVNHCFPEAIAKARYWKTFKKRLNIRNPHTINEKILWLSLHSDISLWTRLADKYAVREYVEGLGLASTLVTLYGKWEKADDIDWNSLPKRFVLKTNNGSGTVLIVNEKDKLDITKTVNVLNRWLKLKPGRTSTEFHYSRITPCVIAEELLENTKADTEYSSTIIDYKVWCFNGTAYYIWVCSNRSGDSTEVALFDRNWNYLPEMSVFTTHYKKQNKLVPKPVNLDSMISVAEKLASPFPVVRVDLYNLDGRIYFGEMTFTSLGGQMDFYTDEALLSMGQMIDISSVRRIR